MNRFQEESVWQSGKFKVDELGRIWRGSRRAEHKVGQYLQVRVHANGVRHYTTAHRLVWRALVGPIPYGMVINHKNGVKTDNRPENLECATYSENTKHAMRHGLRDQRGERNPGAKLKDREVAAIRLAYASGGYTQAQIATQYGVSFQAISKIVRGARRASQMGVTGDYASRRQFRTTRDSKGRIIGRAPRRRLQETPEVARG